MASDDGFLVIGKITQPYGLMGGLRIWPLTDDPRRFQRLTETVLETPGGIRQTCTVTGVRAEKRGVVLFCREFEKVEQVKQFIGGTVQIPPSEVVQLPKDSYFQHDLWGLAVYLEDGRYLGEIEEIWPTGSNDVWVVRDGPHERLIPAIKAVVAEVDLGQKRVTLRFMEGLLEPGSIPERS